MAKPDIISIIEKEGIKLRQRDKDFWIFFSFHNEETPPFKKQKLKDLTRKIIINQKQLPESTECNTDNYQWNSQEYQIQAKAHFDNIIMAKELGLNAQIDLNAKAIFELMFKDYMEVCNIKIKNSGVRPAYYYNEYWIGANIFIKHKLSDKDIFLPKESLQVLTKLQKSSKGFVQEVAIFELRDRQVLSIRIFDNWYSIEDAKMGNTW